jgi:tRNA threonylcarbamoyladenosine biosynthesis protein TsaE
MKLIKKYTSTTVEESAQIAKALSAVFQAGDTVLLEANLGAGKTFIVKKICEYLNSTDEAVSPTFAIIHQYNGPQLINHMDLYRVEDVRELDNLGWEEYLEMGAITFIEWPQIIERQLSDYYKLKINFDAETRIFELYKSEE